MKATFIFVLTFFMSFQMAFAKPVKNGFNLSNSVIPITKVLSGGPPRDGIPSIDKPKFISASKADFLKDDDRVLGVLLDGDARAYPIRILNWHEIVNDDFSGQGVAVTFCPLCGSGIVYSADIEGKKRLFGVSGLLYNSDVLLYDRESETFVVTDFGERCEWPIGQQKAKSTSFVAYQLGGMEKETSQYKSAFN